MKIKRIMKIVSKAIVIALVAVILFAIGTFVFHRIKTNEEIAVLKEKGYYNLVSVGDYSLNVAKLGQENGKHTIVGLAGLGSGDYSVTARQMTTCLEKDNLVVFVDRAGYGFSEDTENEMTLEYIVEDYRRALKNAGIKGPYILMSHSIGGAYANYWASTYPEEIEAIVFLDGSQLNEMAFDEDESYEVGTGDRLFAILAKAGFSRYVIRELLYLYPDNFTEEEQYLGDALTLMTVDSMATISETELLAENAQEAFKRIVTNDIPKLYICSSWGFQTEKEILENNIWTKRQIEKNHLDVEVQTEENAYDDEKMKQLLDEYSRVREEILYPYIERMGNCEIICLPGEHMIYEQKPAECGEIIKSFMDKLEFREEN